MSVRVLVVLVTAALAGALLAASAPFGALFAPLALLAVDLASVPVEVGMPPWPMRAGARLLQTAIVLFVVAVAVRLGASSAAKARWLLPLAAILLAFASLGGAAWSAGTIAGLDHRRPRIYLVEGGLLALMDLGVALWVARLGVVVAEAPLVARWPAVVAIAAALSARGVIAARLSVRARARPGAPGLAATAFVGWLAFAALAAAVRGSPLAWSGLAAALLLTVASAISQARTRTPNAALALGRATLAWMVAACLALLSGLSGAP